MFDAEHHRGDKAKQERKAALRATLAAGKNLPGMPFGLSEANREMPAALGAVGGMYGGPPGAALGGMADFSGSR